MFQRKLESSQEEFPVPPAAGPALIAPIDPAVDLAAHTLLETEAIGDVLQTLLAQGGDLTLHSAQDPPGEGSVHMGRLLLVEAQEHRMVLEAAPSASPPPGRALCVALLQLGGKLQFEVPLSWTGGGGDRAWHATAAWPRELARLDRRLHPRIPVPLGQAYQVSFFLLGRRYVLHIDDLSMGGVGLRAALAEASALYLGRSVPRVVIDLGEDGLVRTDLVVRTRRSFRSYLVGEQIMIGCSFGHLDGDQRERVGRAIDRLARSR